MSRRLSAVVDDVRRSVVIETMKRNGGDRCLVAQALAITPRYLERLLVRYKLTKRRYARRLPIPPLNPPAKTSAKEPK